MRILIVYSLETGNDRRTIAEHLYSFKHYSGEQCYYLNTAYGIPGYVADIEFDLIIYHYTCFAFRFFGEPAFRSFMKKYQILRRAKGYKIAIPQDENVYSAAVCEFFLAFDVKSVFTCLPSTEWEKVYPRDKSGLEHYITVLTGYVDVGAISELPAAARPHRNRLIDLGYRARKVPYWLGRQGLKKWQLTEVFLSAPVEHHMKVSVSNDEKDVFYGDSWYDFLGNCRVVLGCEGGASLHDPDGGIKARVDDYVFHHPRAAFEEVEAACFPGEDGNLRLFALSPRHFEACITRTCQALVEGDYGGVLKPGVHYIEIKSDWSNVVDVIGTISDVAACERIADNAYRDVVDSGLYGYHKFVEVVLGHVRSVHAGIPDRIDAPTYLTLLEMRHRYPFLFSPWSFVVHRLRRVARDAIVSWHLYEGYNRLRVRIRKLLHLLVS